MQTIINGNCLEVLNTIRETKCIIVTDPPFNVGYHYGEYKDNMEEEKYYEMLKSVFMTKGFPFVVIHYPESLYKLSFEIGLFPEKVVSWVYNSNTAKQHRDIAKNLELFISWQC